LEEAGWPVHRLPEEGRGEGLVAAFEAAGDAPGQKIFFPASAIAREEIPTGLRALGAEVDRTTAYRMVTLPVDGEACRAVFEAGELGVVTFASPSAMEALRAGIGEHLFGLLAQGVPAAVMGPTTGAALEGAGWKLISVATEPTLDGLADAVEAAVRRGSGR
jgi:uroporphyrinogen-III synthase